MSDVESLAVSARDGATSTAVVARAAQPRAAVTVLPAMGTAASYYAPLAEALASRGFTALVAEHRGTGSSSVVPKRGVDFGYEDALRLDLPAALDATRALAPGQPLVVIGHSLGAHLASLFVAAHPRAVDGLAIVAAGSVHYRAYPPSARLRILLGTQLAAGVAALLGYYPGDKLGFGGRQPRRIIADWARLGRTGAFRPQGAQIDYEARMRSCDARVHFVRLEGDTLSPASATDALAAKFASARVTSATLRLPPGKADPHFRWVRSPTAVLDALEPFLAGPSADAQARVSA